ncbi:hypothetical protein HK096_004768 [Nowakowskiella sp. JEL0078]|nr:hypothetical protein HK096_004768 [Nowakowskiella sp. JEL0078]
MSTSSEHTKDSYFSVPLNPSSNSVRKHLTTLNAYQRHQKFVRDYQNIHKHDSKLAALTKSAENSRIVGKTELDILKQHHRFLRENEDNFAKDDSEDYNLESWEKRVAQKYYDQLFKEFAVGDLRRYKDGRIALRWRTEREVVDGKGQFTCGNLYCTTPPSSAKLKSWEMNFAYVEQSLRKNALVKLRLCNDCALKLNYRKQKDLKKEKEKLKKRSREKAVEEVTEKRSKHNETEYIDDNLLEEVKSDIQNETDLEDSKDLDNSKERLTNLNSSNIWSQSIDLEEKEVTFEEELDEYFKELFQ